MKFSEMSVVELKNTPWFHRVNPEKFESFSDCAHWLESILHNPCNVWEENGETFLVDIRQLVVRINGLSIEVYSNEHPPPHFHVKAPNINASFDIENCEILQGKINAKDQKKILYWHKHAKPLLIKAWNSTRPTNCSVGQYAGS